MRRGVTGSLRVRMVGHTLTTSVLRYGVGALATVALMRALGPDGRGTYAVLVNLATTAMILGNLSVEPAHVSLWSRLHNHDAIAPNSLLLGLALGTLAALIAFAVVGLSGGLLPVLSPALLAVALAAVPCYLISRYLVGLLYLTGRVRVVNWAALFAAAVQCLSLVLFAAAGRLSVGWAVGLWTVSVAAPLAILLPAARPRFGAADLSLARRTIAMGVRYHAGNVSRFLLMRVDILILGAMVSSAEVGLYSLAVTMIELTRLAADTIAQVVLRDQVEGDLSTAAAVTSQATRMAALLTMGSVALMCGAAPLLIPLCYGSAFRDSIGPLLWLAPGLVVFGSTRPVGAFLLRLARPAVESTISFVGLLVGICGCLALIPRFGIVGAGAATSSAYAALAVMQVAWFVRATRTPIRRLIPTPRDIRAARLAMTVRASAPRNSGHATTARC
jgi:O-antigen/teichoic acid export membrane protein